MSVLYTKASLLAARIQHHGGSGLEDGGLRFFRSQEEFDKLAKEHGWREGKSRHSSWCTEPVMTEVLVRPKVLKRFLNGGQAPTVNQVFVAASKATDVHKIGVMRF